jgi:hypothetical protein
MLILQEGSMLGAMPLSKAAGLPPGAKDFVTTINKSDRTGMQEGLFGQVGARVHGSRRLYQVASTSRDTSHHAYLLTMGKGKGGAQRSELQVMQKNCS